MTPLEFVREWIESLRSKEYKQGQKQLSRYFRGKDSWEHCCIGVACKVGVSKGLVNQYMNPRFLSDEMGYYMAGKEENLPPLYREAVNNASYTAMPPELSDWLGWNDIVLPIETIPEGSHELPYIESTLMRLNDGEGRSFEQIADFIERWIVPLYDPSTGEPIRTRNKLPIADEGV